MPHTKAALTIVATLVLTLPACTSGPRLSDRNAAEEPSEAILRLAIEDVGLLIVDLALGGEDPKARELCHAIAGLPTSLRTRIL